MVLLFSPVFTLKEACCCCGEIWSKRTRVFEDDVFIENTRLVGGSKTQNLNLRADLVLNMSRGHPGNGFPRLNMWASAIFVGTSGIPPKIIYRSVKSYMPPPQIDKYWKYFSTCSLTRRQNCVTVDCVVMNECKCIFLAWELVRTFFDIPCGHKVKFWCCLVCRTASTQC